MAVTEVKKQKKYPSPAETSPMQEFYLERQQFMDPSKRYSVPIIINGFEFTAYFGEKNILPKDCVDVLKNAKSAVHPMENAGKVEIARGGEGRNQSQLLNAAQTVKYIPDYNVVLEKEL